MFTRTFSAQSQSKSSAFSAAGSCTLLEIVTCRLDSKTRLKLPLAFCLLFDQQLMLSNIGPSDSHRRACSERHLLSSTLIRPTSHRALRWSAQSLLTTPDLFWLWLCLCSSTIDSAAKAAALKRKADKMTSSAAEKKEAQEEAERKACSCYFFQRIYISRLIFSKFSPCSHSQKRAKTKDARCAH